MKIELYRFDADDSVIWCSEMRSVATKGKCVSKLKSAFAILLIVGSGILAIGMQHSAAAGNLLIGVTANPFKNAQAKGVSPLTAAQSTLTMSVPASAVNQTLFLLNNTLTPGNWVGGNGLAPADILYVPAANAVYVTESSSALVTVLNASTLSVMTYIRVGYQPNGMAYDPVNGYLYVANPYSSNVSVINTTTNRVVASVTVGSGDFNVAYIPVYGDVYVSDEYMSKVSAIDTLTNTILLNINVGSYPTAMMYDASTGYTYVANSGSSNISVINSTTNTVAYTISLPNNPTDAVFDPANGCIYYAAATAGLVSVLNMTTRTVVANITVGSDPAYISYDQASGLIYTTNMQSNNISVINTTTDKVIAGVNVGLTPAGTAIDAVTGSLLVAESGSNNITSINTSTDKITGSVLVGITPDSVIYDGSNNDVYVANAITNNVSVISGSTGKVISSVHVGGTPTAMAYDPANNAIYVVNSGNYNVSVISGATDTVTANINVGNGPRGVVYDPTNGNVYVSNEYSENISVINTTSNTVTATIAMYSLILGLAYDPSNGLIYVSGQGIFGNGAVFAIDTFSNTVVSTVDVGPSPDSMAFDPANGYLYVANTGAYNLSVVNTETDSIDYTVNVSSTPLSIAYDPVNGCVYATNENTGNISVIYTGTNTIAGSVTVGTQPEALAYDGFDNSIYCANYGSGTLSTISSGSVQEYSVNITETGLPSGTNWSATVAGLSQSSSTASVTFKEFNGTYDYTIQNVGNYTASPSAGTLTVNGPGQKLNVTFSVLAVNKTTYPVTFAENGLPSGVTWYLNISNGQDFTVTGSASTTAPEQNGSYTYTASSSNLSWICQPGSFVVNGTSLVIELYFTTGQYGVTMNETGLPSGAQWYFNITGGIAVTSRNSSAVAQEPNGTYSYTVSSGDKTYAPVKSAGSFTVHGAAVALAVSFAEITYNATFTESGLPVGTEWFVNVSTGISIGSAGTAITLSEPNGTYSYSIGTADNAYAANGGSFSISGASLSLQVNFNHLSYAVSMSESGLPAGTSWWWNITGGNSYLSSGSSVQASFPNGSYLYTVSSTDGQYAPSPSSGTFTVNGQPVVLSVAFSPVAAGGTYSCTFTEVGLPSGAEWFLNLSNGQSFSSVATRMAFAMPNGTYSYSLGTVDKQYTSKDGTFTVNGAPLSVDVSFSEITYNVTFTESGLQAGTTWSATLNGINISSATPTITFAEPNGTYSYSIGTESGYNQSAASGTLAVQGSSVTVPVSFSRQSGSQTNKTPNSPAGLLPGGDMTYLLVGVILVVALGGAAFTLSRRKKN